MKQRRELKKLIDFLSFKSAIFVFISPDLKEKFDDFFFKANGKNFPRIEKRLEQLEREGQRRKHEQCQGARNWGESLFLIFFLLSFSVYFFSLIRWMMSER